MGAPEVEAFLTHLAVQGKLAASTQNQALAVQELLGHKDVSTTMICTT
jgi:site-specific recombinase XerC